MKKSPKDAYCTVLIMNSDMAPNFDWNFAYGYAYFNPKIGVFSFARYDEGFFEEDNSGEKDWE